MDAFLLVLALLAIALLAQSASRRRPADRDGARRARLAARIESLLPQTQCRQCGYAGCGPYAAAIAAGSADVHRCPPGGAATVRGLERLLGLAVSGAGRPVEPAPAAPIARIDEDECIGCVKCVRACPVDAIIGAAGQLHGVLADRCTGCALCIAPCPVDCITLVPAAVLQPWRWPDPARPAEAAG